MPTAPNCAHARVEVKNGAQIQVHTSEGLSHRFPKAVATPEALAIDVDQGIKGEQVVEAMTRISSIRGAPKTIRVDNGPEFISTALDRWAYENGVTLDFSR